VAWRWNSEVELADGKGLSGTGLPRNSHNAFSNIETQQTLGGNPVLHLGIMPFIAFNQQETIVDRSAKVTICYSS